MAQWVAYTGLAATLAISVGTWLDQMFTLNDAHWYLALASGQSNLVPQPFTSRQLAPLICRGLSYLGHWPVAQAFYTEGVLAIIVLVAATGTILVGEGVPVTMLIAVGALALWSQLFNGLVLPDLLNAALLSVFLLLLWQEKLTLAAAMMFPLMVSRESSILVAVCLLYVGWKSLRPFHVGLIVIATASGLVVVRQLTGQDTANVEHISPLLYILGKIPWNALKNIAGVNPWSNISYHDLCTPVWQMPFHLGALQAVGFCSPSARQPVELLVSALSAFGLLPLQLASPVHRQALRRGTIMLRFCLLYGGTSFLLAPLIGPSLVRLFQYGWPLFVLGIPIVTSRSEGVRWSLALAMLSVLVSWINLLSVGIAALLSIVAAYVIAWRQLRPADGHHGTAGSGGAT
jgi:hypothetical protein